MNNRIVKSAGLALIASVLAIGHASADEYGRRPDYNHYAYRGYAPSAAYGYRDYHRNHTVRNVAIGAGVGAAAGVLIGLLAANHGHGY